MYIKLYKWSIKIYLKIYCSNYFYVQIMITIFNLILYMYVIIKIIIPVEDALLNVKNQIWNLQNMIEEVSIND